MAILTTQLILAGTLFVSSSHPALVRGTAPDAWFSDPQALSVQPLSQGLMIRAQDSYSLVQALGLDAAQPSELTRIQNLSDANYEALKRCPQAPVEASPEGLRISSKLALSQNLETLHRCGFEALGLSDETSLEPELAASFAIKESEASGKGHRILSADWQHGRRVILVDEAQLRHAKTLRKLFSTLSPLLEIRSKRAPRPGNTLIFEVTLFEFFRNAARKIGVSWPDNFRLLNLDGDPFKKLNPKVMLGLDFGESLGVGKILARPQLRVRAGQTARFQSGGEIPVQLVTETTQSTQWKPYGLILELGVPAETSTGAQEIGLDFKVELSEPDFSRGTTSTPGLQMRRLESRFDIRAYETTVLSTMVQSRSGALRSGLAGLGQAPVLKHLFSSKSQQEQESELWFAVRPVWDEIPWEEEQLDDVDSRIRKL